MAPILQHKNLTFLFTFFFTFTFSQLYPQPFQKADSQTHETNGRITSKVDNPNFAVDGTSKGNLGTYSTLNASAGAALGLGYYSTSQTLSFPSTVSAGKTTYIRIDTETGLFKAILGGALGNLLSDVVGGVLLGNQIIAIQTQDENGNPIKDYVSNNPQGAINGFNNNEIKIVVNDLGETFIAITPNQNYKSIRIKNSMLSVLGLFNSANAKLYGAYYNQGNCDDAILTSFTASGGLLSANLLSSPVENPENAINSNPSDFSTLSLPTLSVAGSVTQKFHFDKASNTDDSFHISLASTSNNLAQIELLKGISIEAYNNGVQVDSKTLQEINSLIDLDLLTLLQNNQRLDFSYTPGSAADEIRISIGNLVNISLEGVLQIYDIQKDPAKPTTLPATEVTSASAKLNADLNDPNNCTFDEYGFEYSTDPNFAEGSGTYVQSSNALNGAYSHTLSNLDPEKEYYFRAVVKRTINTKELISYGDVESFQTNIITWNGTQWDNSIGPNLTQNALIDGDYDTSADGSISVKNLNINPNQTLTTDKINGLTISGDIINNGVIDSKFGQITYVGSSDQNLNGNHFLENSIGILQMSKGTSSQLSVSQNVEITDNIELNQGILKLTPSSNVILKNNQNHTAYVNTISDCNLIDIIYEGTHENKGRFTTEIFIPNETSTNSVNRSYRFLTSSVNSFESINANWQEGETISNYSEIQNSTAGDYGTHITGWNATNGNNQASGLDFNQTGASSMYSYDNINQVWNPVTSTVGKSFIAGKPFFILIRGNRLTDLSNNDSEGGNTILRASGELKICDQTINTTLAENPDEFSLIGNPYHAPIDMSSVLSNSTDINTNYYWYLDPNLGERKGTYVVVDLSDGTSNINPGAAGSGVPTGNQYVQAGQGFLVQNANNFTASPKIVFKESDKNINSGSNTSVFSDIINTQGLQISVNLLSSNQRIIDGTKIIMNQSYTDDINQEDAKRVSFNKAESISTIENGKLLMINKKMIPTEENITKLSIDNYQFQNYSLSISVSQNENFSVFLIDNYLDEIIEIEESLEYQFEVDLSINETIIPERFLLKTSPVTLNIEQKSKNNISVYPNPVEDYFTIKTHEPYDNLSIKIYNNIGQLIDQKNLKKDSAKVNISNYQAGVYSIEITTDKFKTTKKIIKK